MIGQFDVVHKYKCYCYLGCTKHFSFSISSPYALLKNITTRIQIFFRQLNMSRKATKKSSKKTFLTEKKNSHLENFTRKDFTDAKN